MVPPPPDYPAAALSHLKPNISRPPAMRLRLGKVDVVLEETTLSEVIEKIGLGLHLHQGDAAESVDWVCYTFRLGGSLGRVWLTSSEMHGGSVVDGATITLLPPTGNSAPSQCPVLPTRYAPVSLDGGITAGMDDAALVSRLGVPARRRKDLAIYLYAGPVVGENSADHKAPDRASDFEVTSMLAAQVEHGRVRRIWVRKTTSN